MNFLFNGIVERRLDFEKRRKLHYNEFEALKLARKLLEEDEEEDDDDGSKSAHKTVDQTHESPSASGDRCNESSTNSISAAAAAVAATDEVEMDNANDNS